MGKGRELYPPGGGGGGGGGGLVEWMEWMECEDCFVHITDKVRFFCSPSRYQAVVEEWSIILWFVSRSRAGWSKADMEGP